MGWIGNIFDRLSGQVAQVPPVDHPVFGRIQPSHRPKNEPWLWETLDSIDTPRGSAGITLEAHESGPDADQARHWEWICANVDQLTSAAVPLIGPQLEVWLERPFPADPWAELEWEGAHLTRNSSPEGDWQMSYASKSWPDAMITVYFEGGRPTIVQIDD